MLAEPVPVVLVHHRELTTKQDNGVRTAPPKAERLICACGCDQFHVTKVDFACAACHRSYRD